MNRFRIGVGLLIVLLAVCIFSQVRMSAIQKPIAAEVAQAERYAAQDDWPKAGAALAGARNAWEENRTFVASLADHQPLEDIESLFAMLEAYAEERDGTEFRAACQDLNRRILAVKEAHEFNLGSVF
ncbi:MAG: DUF4363 family protein [Faecousia sp.]